MTIVYILIAIFAFGFLIFVHELGHYVFAKIFKVTVSEFSIGMGPKIFSRKGKDGADYSLRLLPLGGYVAMAGEDEESDDPNAFNKKSAWKRFIIVAAGALTNLLIGFLIMTVLMSTNDVFGTTKVGAFTEGATSSEYLQIGDEIIEVDGTSVHTFTELNYEISRKGYKPISITVLRDGKEMTFENVQFPVTPPSDGVSFGSRDFKVYGEKRSFGTVMKNTFYSCKSTVKMVYDSLFDLFSGRYGIKQVSGPVGVTEVITEAAKTDMYTLFYIIVVISINVGIFNLLPIPALDGGALLLLIVEAIIRRPIPKKIEYAIKATGFAILMTIVIVITVKDIIYLF